MYKTSKMALASKIVWASKTAIAKTTAKITTTALLFFLALFTLTTNLKAQAVQDNSKSGFFAGFVVLDGFQVDSTKSVTTSETTSYRVTGYEDDETTRIDATGGNLFWDDALQTGVKTLISANCKTGETSVDSNGEYYLAGNNFSSFDPGKKPTAEQIAEIRVFTPVCNASSQKRFPPVASILVVSSSS